VTGTQVTERHHALTSVAELLRNGRIIVLKGLGGFQLLVDARHEAAVPRLRERKQRPAKRYSI
jgi:hydrogenase maturation protein HypF